MPYTFYTFEEVKKHIDWIKERQKQKNIPPFNYKP